MTGYELLNITAVFIGFSMGFCCELNYVVFVAEINFAV